MEVRPHCFTALLAGILLLASCQEKVPSQEVTVTFSLLKDNGTRSGSAEESDIRRWALLLFRDGQFVDYGLSSSPAPITRTLQTGSYIAYAVANYPEASFHPESFRVPKDLTDGTADLFDNAFDAPVMFGRADLSVSSEDTPAIAVERLVCKAGIRKISVDFTDPTLAGQAFVLKRIFLTNCCRLGRYGSDRAWEDLPESESDWYHPMGHELSGNALLTASGLETPITPQTPCLIPHDFLYYPNPTGLEADTHDNTWSPRCTRLVIEAQIGNRTCYYPVTLPPVPRNRTCIVEEVIIRRAGSSDPEQVVPDAVEIAFSATVQPWEQQYHEKDAH